MRNEKRNRVRRMALIIALCLAAGLLFGCQCAEMGEPTLTVTEEWAVLDFMEEKEPTVKSASESYAEIEKGTVIFDDPQFGTISVIAVNDRRVRLRIDHSLFVKVRDNGTIDLTARRIKTLTVRRGEEIKIAPGVFDGCFSLSIRYD